MAGLARRAIGYIYIYIYISAALPSGRAWRVGCFCQVLAKFLSKISKILFRLASALPSFSGILRKALGSNFPCWAYVGLSWPILALCWPILVPCWPILGLLTSIFAHLGPTWLQHGPNLAQHGPTWSQLGPTWLTNPRFLTDFEGHVGSQNRQKIDTYRKRGKK